MSIIGQAPDRPHPLTPVVDPPSDEVPPGEVADEVLSGEAADEVLSGEVAARIVTGLIATTVPRTWGAHDHDGHELLWGVRGALTARVGDEHFVLPSALGLWIPAGVAHQVHAGRDTRFFCTHLAIAVPDRLRTGPRTVCLTPVVRELLLYLHNRLMGDDLRANAERLVVDLLEDVDLRPVTLREPIDPRALRVARHLLAHPDDEQTLDQWCRRVGASPRHMSRVFRKETGATFAQWRIHARVRAAVPLLVQGMPVATVARRVGYGSASAFVHAFGQVMGLTPGAYVRRSLESPPAVAPWADDAA